MQREDVQSVPVEIGRLATVSEAGAVLDVSERTVGRLIKSGELDGVSISGRRYVTRQSLFECKAARARGEKRQRNPNQMTFPF